jgi:hypothetical protein
MGQIAEYITAVAKMSVGLSEAMLKDVKPEIFARKPILGGKVIEANHAAFVFGHLALYPTRWLVACGLDGSRIMPPAGFDDLFAAGKECRDDPDGKIYPSMNEITEAFFSAHRYAIEQLPSVSDAVLSGPNPREQSRSRLPTLAPAMIFYTSAHMMMHLGQVSTWRRCFGLGPVM